MKLAEAEALAREVVDWLRPACDAAVIVGSIRRKKPEVKDIEIAVRPAGGKARPVFGDPTSLLTPLDRLLARQVAQKVLSYDLVVRRDGPRYKRFLLRFGGPLARFDGAPLDLFIADEDNWGNTLVIRTGNADFSRLLMTPRQAGGLMPTGLRQRDGYLWRGETKVPCPTETSYFEACGIPAGRIPLPELRDATTIGRLRAQLREARRAS